MGTAGSDSTFRFRSDVVVAGMREQRMPPVSSPPPVSPFGWRHGPQRAALLAIDPTKASLCQLHASSRSAAPPCSQRMWALTPLAMQRISATAFDLLFETYPRFAGGHRPG